MSLIEVDFRRKHRHVDGIQYATFSHTGHLRHHNEDRVLARPDLGLYVVCDGLGGHAAGEVAAQLTVDTIAGVVARRPRPFVPSDLAVAVERAHDVVRRQSQKTPEHDGMATTVVAVLLLPPDPEVPSGHNSIRIAVAWSGDSRLALGQRERLADGSLRTRLFILTDDQEHNGFLTHAIGVGDESGLELRVYTIDPGDTLLLYTDGLYREVADMDLMRHLCGGSLKPTQEIADRLCETALTNGGRDNVSGIVIRLG